MWRHTAGLGLLLGAALLGAAGCTQKDQPLRVGGLVTLDGKPLGGVTVKFSPPGVENEFACATTRDDGSFALVLPHGADPAGAGDYTVMVTPSWLRLAVGRRPPRQGKEVRALLTRALKEARKAPPGKGQGKLPDVPAVYRDAATTPLRQKIPPDGPIRLNLRTRERDRR